VGRRGQQDPAQLTEYHLSATPVALLLIDVDEFKIVNDSLGHTAGDELLIRILQKLKDVVRRTDTVSRPHNSGVREQTINGDTLASGLLLSRRRPSKKIHV
jgi:predicted signal transduction protein with EAL and GGDEF domain